jgi:spore coat protein U-like protein
MVNGTTNFLTYQLFKPDAGGFTTVWGNTAGPDLVADPGTGLAQTYVVHGRVAGGQNPPNGNYSDTVLATVNF